MRKAGVLVTLITVAVIYLLDVSVKPGVPALGRLLDPVNGCWANAEPVDKDFSANIRPGGLTQPVTVRVDSQMVPHIEAANDHDLYFMEGYIHAQARLWQMDMQTRAAGGNVSEVVGVKALDFDRKQRRKGMVYAAENSLRAMEGDPRTRVMLDAYTQGVNAYISGLAFRDYPLEYKLMAFRPTPWTNLRTALLMKYMADDLTGSTDDMALTYLRDVLPPGILDKYFPEKVAGSKTVIPAGTAFGKPSLPTPVAPPDSLAFPHYNTTDYGSPVVAGKGSNNWAISGSRTASGATILCNDPHLALNLPSLWYEIQLQAPGINVFGASLPGAPGIIIGFNDSLTWGLTNNYRDVKDFYDIKPVDGGRDKYWFAGKQLPFTNRIEHIAVKGKPDVIDTVLYTIHGPVMYDGNYKSSDGLQRTLAVNWMAYRATNELLAIYLLDRAKNYDQYVAAIMNFQCPAQNIIYADRAGNIALWGQGQFVNKWKEQGRFVMNGSDSSTLWGQLIPMSENPHALNPLQGYLASANECVTDSTYPYWYNGDFSEVRAWRINEVLAQTPKATIADMFRLQNDTHSYIAAQVLPVMLSACPDVHSQYLDSLKQWNYDLSPHSHTASMFQTWWEHVRTNIWLSEKMKDGRSIGHIPDDLAPSEAVMMQLVIAHHDAFAAIIRRSFSEAAEIIAHKQDAQWYEVKNTTVSHLTKLPAFSYDHLLIGGSGNTVNAAKSDHGPSWRMVVQMGKEIEAYGIYPGGQSGNPGSKYYADYLPMWVEGRYNRLHFFSSAAKPDSRDVRYIINAVPN
jgi:penicillin G amidase